MQIQQLRLGLLKVGGQVLQSAPVVPSCQRLPLARCLCACPSTTAGRFLLTLRKA
jgi:hypothetical protein